MKRGKRIRPPRSNGRPFTFEKVHWLVFNGTWKAAIEIRLHCVVAICGCSLAPWPTSETVSFRPKKRLLPTVRIVENILLVARKKIRRARGGQHNLSRAHKRDPSLSTNLILAVSSCSRSRRRQKIPRRFSTNVRRDSPAAFHPVWSDGNSTCEPRVNHLDLLYRVCVCVCD